MSSMDTLNPDQKEKIDSFIAVTSWQDDPSSVVPLLQAAQWNLELALSRHFDDIIFNTNTTNYNLESTNNIIEGDISRSNESEDSEHQILSSEPISTEPSCFNAKIRSILLFPLTTTFQLGYSIFYILSYILPFISRITGIYTANRSALHSERKPVDPKDTSARFIRLLDENYGVKDLGWFQGGYSQALEQAKQNLFFLIVILYSGAHDDSSAFVRDVLSSSKVAQFLKEERIIIWGGNVRESEAFQVASLLKCTSYPFTALSAPSAVMGISVRKMVVLKKIQHLTSASNWITILKNAINSHRGQLASLLFDQQERDMVRRLREEQEEAYERSLAIDQARELSRREAEKNAENANRERIHLEELRQQWKRWRAYQISQKPQPSQGSFARVSIRFTSGTRINRCFLPSDTVEDIYAYVECYELLKNASEFADQKPPDDYIHNYTFKLVSPMPCKVFAPTTDRVDGEPVIWPNGVLVVEPNFD